MSRNLSAVIEGIKSIISSHDIVLFGKLSCGYCKKATQILIDAKFPAHVVYISDEQGDALGQMTGNESVPSIWIKGKYIGGCNDGPESWMGLTKIMKNGTFESYLKPVSGL